MKLLSILAVAAVVSAELKSSVPHNLLWPKPQLFTSGTVDRTINPDLVSFSFTGGDLRLLQKAGERFKANSLAQGCNAPGIKGDIRQINVTITGCDPKDLADESESYTLDTTEDSVVITAENTVGAIRAFETLSQLVRAKDQLPFYAAKDVMGCAKAADAGFAPGFEIPAGPWHIEDHPNYSYRSIHLDTSRNFIPVQDILRTLDGMVATKLNVLNWHVSDATAFPMVSMTYPDLTDRAYNKLAVYTYNDANLIIRYAAERGIRVIPEFDHPAHTDSFSASKELNPFILCQNSAVGWINPYNGGVGNEPLGNWWPHCVEPPCGAVNIADPKAGPAISKLMMEYASLFPDSVMHLGGDEVSSFCYATEPAYLEKVFPGMTNYSSVFPNAEEPYTFPEAWFDGFARVYQNYIDGIIEDVKEVKKTTMHWEDIILNDFVDLPEGSIIQIWNGWNNKLGKNSLQRILELNKYQIVDTNNENYYLDGGAGKWLTDSLGYGNQSAREDYWLAYRNWQHIYNHDPRTSPMQNVTDVTGTGLADPPKGNLSLIIGASAAIWGEKIDSLNLDIKLWPRAAAMAEALWSSFDDAANKDMFEAEPRLVKMRERLMSRGMEAEAMHPEWCDDNLCGFLVGGNKSSQAFNQNESYWFN
ncbi:hypothetical protein HDU98_010309 [Podochytrium sp. JEL0797]|nr:hypothetical protein HDU98_010309 [Podochytrium sp. JEL0797]